MTDPRLHSMEESQPPETHTVAIDLGDNTLSAKMQLASPISNSIPLFIDHQNRFHVYIRDKNGAMTYTDTIVADSIRMVRSDHVEREALPSFPIEQPSG